MLAPIAQLDRVFDFESRGCGFDSCWARQKLINNKNKFSIENLFFYLNIIKFRK